MAVEFVSSWTYLIFMLLLGGGSGVPLGVPPLPDDATLARIAPEECLVYFSSAGMAKPDAKSTNQTEKLFAEPEVQRFAAGLEQLIRAGLVEGAAKQGPEAKARAEDGAELAKVLLTRPVAVYLGQLKVQPKEAYVLRAGAVVSLGDDADKVTGAIERILAALVPVTSKEETVAGTKFHRLSFPNGAPDVTWGVKDKYLYLATGEGEIEALVKRAGGEAPKWLTELRKSAPVERVSTVTMIHVRPLADALAPVIGPEATKFFETTGLTGIERFSSASGLDKEEMVSRSLVSLKGEPKGLLRLAEQKPLTTADIDLIPRDATMALAWKLDAQRAFSTVLAALGQAEPRDKEGLDAPTRAQRELLDAIFKALGDSWCVFDSPGGGGMFTGVTAAVSLKDRDAAEAVQKRLLATVEESGKNVPDERRRPRVQRFEIGGKVVHVLDLRDKNFPLAPSWCLTDTHLVVGLFPESVKAFLSRGKMFPTLGAAPEVKAALEGDGDLLSLSYVNTQRVFDLAYPFVPWLFHNVAAGMRTEGVEVPPGLLPYAGSIRRHLRPTVSTTRRTPAGIETVTHQTLPGNMGVANVPVAVGLLVPAVQKVREAAARIQSSNNLKQCALAMHNYHDTYGHFPAAYTADKAGKPLLSWRVAILPFIEQDALYKEFHLDEPWDSPHNKQLIEKMPKTFRSPNSQAPAGYTNYETVRGKDTMFPGDKGVKYADVTDGLSNTVMIVEVSDKKAVPWTKPDDFEYNEKDPGAGLFGMWPQGFLAAMGDGAVRVISNSTTPKVLRDLFLRNDGNALPPDF